MKFSIKNFFRISSQIADLVTLPKKFRNSRPEVFSKKGVVENFKNFTGKHLCQSFFFNKYAGLM